MIEPNWSEAVRAIANDKSDWSWVSERVIKVDHPEGPMAMKRWQRTVSERDTFLHHLRYGERAGIQGIIPLMTGTRGDFPIFEHEGADYYLEPWVEEQLLTSPPSKELRLLAILAANHKLSENEQVIEEEAMTEYAQEVDLLWNQQRLTMEQMADQMEQVRFLSPFTMTFLHAGPFLERMFQAGRTGFQQWVRHVKDQGSYRFVFCHGQPSLEHGIIASDGNAWWTNWEESGPNHMAYDLAYFYQDIARNQPFHALDQQAIFGTYEAYGPVWREADTSLLKALMLTPTPVIEFVELYRTNPNRYAEHQWTAMLEVKLNTLRYLSEMVRFKEDQEAAMRQSST
ncbi:hypothetical protein [Geomicrobium sediminis]|uniref:Spore coat protein YsxE n=1 Tax=Geomicrobium sediminis TaxID=1347788 RepID=A0ABS2P8J6_9BACL|nr:hypothetical protein [Geomicrobium sediminis]MBM7631676.1 spore coat protein YsxE [Geomicrobium sediminis]